MADLQSSSRASSPSDAPSRAAFWTMLQRIALLAGAVDVIFLVTFWALGFHVASALNILSIATYVAAYLLLRRRKNLIAVALMWLEVLLHASVSTYMFGWNSGTHYFLLVFLPAVAVSRSTRQAVVAMLLLLAFYLGLDALTQGVTPLYEISEDAKRFVRWLSVSVVFMMFGYTGRYYVQRVAASEKRLRQMAATDPLSGLFNRRRFLEQTELETARAARHGGPLCVALIDIDHFKRINDEHGHDIGDRVICQVARVLSAELRTNDVVARWGGEEFILLLPDTGPDGAAVLAQRIVDRMGREGGALGDRTLAVTVSIGVHPVDAARPFDESVKGADQALYQAKARGRNRVGMGIAQAA